VSVFPLRDEKPLESEVFDADAFLDRWRVRLSSAADRVPPPVHDAPIHHVGEDFERLRDTADRMARRSGSSPAVAGVLIGRPAEYTARLDWIRDLLATAGIHLVERGADDDGTFAGMARLNVDVAAVIIIAPDALHGTAVPVAASALRQAGASSIIVAGRAGEHEAVHRQAGVSGYVYAGADVVAFLHGLLEAAHTAHERS
jgi:methylmalonyl-CoA mutase